MKAKCLGADQALCPRQGWLESSGGCTGEWVGGVVGWRAVWRPQGLWARSAEKSSVFLQHASQVLESSKTS